MKKYKFLLILIILGITLSCIWFVYNSEYRYANTELGRIAAVEEYVLTDDSSLDHSLQFGTPIEILGWHEAEDTLFVFFQADTENHVRGVLHMVRGLNGKYMPIEQHMHPSQFTVGVDGITLTPENSESKLYALIGQTDYNISYAEITYAITDYTGILQPKITKRFDLTENFVTVLDYKEMIQELGFVINNDTITLLHTKEMRLYDKNGNDVTNEYKDSSVDLSWVGFKGSGSIALINLALYSMMGFIALGGVIIVRLIWKSE